MKNLYSLVVFLVIGISISVHAQQKNVSRSNQQWIQYYNQTKLSDKWTWQIDGGNRWKNGFKESTQYIVRTGISYAFLPNISVAAGFGHLGFFSSCKINKVEFRPYQEMLIKNNFKKVAVSHRYRIEERFFNPVLNGEIQTPNTFNFRFRYSFMASIPLFKLSKTNPDKLFLLNIGDELFMNAGKGIVNNVFDQNRLIISPSIQFSKNLTVSFTWNSQFAASTIQGEFFFANVMWLQVKHNVNLSRKTERK